MHQEIYATLNCSPKREHTFVCGLSIKCIGCANVARAIWHVVATRKLATSHCCAHVFGSAECGCARLHVDIACEPAICHWCAWTNNLSKCHACERFGILLRECASESDRCHCTSQCKWRDDNYLIARRELHDALQHRCIKSQRRG